MKKLKKILLINWLYYSKQLIHIGDINFLTGKTGAGKSTIIDALQIVLLGELNARNFNKAVECSAAFAIGLIIGCYDGLIGPGTGTFLIICFSGILGLDLLVSGGCAKVSNLASNLASGVVYLFNGKAMYSILLPAALCSILGGWLGSRFAIKGGSKRIKKVMFLVLGLLFAKMIYDYFF